MKGEELKPENLTLAQLGFSKLINRRLLQLVGCQETNIFIEDYTLLLAKKDWWWRYTVPLKGITFKREGPLCQMAAKLEELGNTRLDWIFLSGNNTTLEVVQEGIELYGFDIPALVLSPLIKLSGAYFDRMCEHSNLYCRDKEGRRWYTDRTALTLRHLCEYAFEERDLDYPESDFARSEKT